eukprot:Platyproteum_vivax@DN15177_c0_g1_i1.p1
MYEIVRAIFKKESLSKRTENDWIDWLKDKNRPVVFFTGLSLLSKLLNIPVEVTDVKWCKCSDTTIADQLRLYYLRPKSIYTSDTVVECERRGEPMYVKPFADLVTRDFLKTLEGWRETATEHEKICVDEVLNGAVAFINNPHYRWTSEYMDHTKIKNVEGWNKGSSQSFKIERDFYRHNALNTIFN